MANDSPRIYVGDTDQAFPFEILLDRSIRLGPGERHGEILTDQAGDFDRRRLYLAGFRSVISDMDIGGYQELSEVRGIGKDFLIAGHTGIEANFPGGRPDFTSGFAVEDCSVFQEQDGGGWFGLSRMRHCQSAYWCLKG